MLDSNIMGNKVSQKGKTSADAVTVAVMNTTSLDIYRLQKKSGDSIFCEGNCW